MAVAGVSGGKLRTCRDSAHGVKRGYMPFMRMRTPMSPLRKPMAVAQPGACTVTLCLASGGSASPKPVVSWGDIMNRGLAEWKIDVIEEESRRGSGWLIGKEEGLVLI